MFAGVATPFLLLVYSSDDLAALGRGTPYDPLKFDILSSLDGKMHYVEWASSGSRGSFIVTCETPATSCTVTSSLEPWIL
jgi:hypothetical protein